MALLHMVKERKTPSLSAQTSFAPFSLKVAWSGKSLIMGGGHVKFYPHKKGRGLKKFYPVLRGGAKSFGPVLFPFC